MTRPPVVVCLDRDPTAVDARRLRPGAPLAAVAAALGAAPGTVVGVVGEDQVVGAIDAVQRGWDLVMRLDLRGELRRLVLDDLAHIGQLRDESALGQHPLLDPLDDDLLTRLAAGDTVRTAAHAVGVSDRTAARRLAALRKALGVATTAGLVARWRSTR